MSRIVINGRLPGHRVRLYRLFRWLLSEAAMFIACLLWLFSRRLRRFYNGFRRCFVAIGVVEQLLVSQSFQWYLSHCFGRHTSPFRCIVAITLRLISLRLAGSLALCRAGERYRKNGVGFEPTTACCHAA